MSCKISPWKYYRIVDGDFYREPYGSNLLLEQRELPLLEKRVEPDRSAVNGNNANSMEAAYRYRQLLKDRTS